MEALGNEQVRTRSGGESAPIGDQRTFSRQEIEQLVDQLKEPFDPRVVQWVVTATGGGKDGHRRGLLAAYADPRAYMDRLNHLLTPSGWTQEYSTEIIPSCPRKVRDKQITSAKLLVICRLTLFGLGAHSGTGEGWGDDENALTSADAQAFKRAGVPFGLGRYFYDLPQTWVDLDEHDRPRWLPDLPDWALPQEMRGKATGNAGTGRNGSGRDGGRPSGNGHFPNGHGVTAAAGNVRGQTLSEVEALSKQVGRSIFRSITVSVAGVENPAQVGDVGKLKEIAERLRNAGRGVERLKAAVGTVGLDALAAACHELKLSSTLTDEIPDTKVLRHLVDRLEEQSQALAPTEPAPQASGSNKPPGNNGSHHGATSGSDFAGSRNEVLTLARRLANSSKRPIADIVVWASGGTFQYADIGKLTPTDLPKLQGAVRCLQQAVNEPKH